MQENVTSFTYHAFGLNFLSNFWLPELILNQVAAKGLIIPVEEINLFYQWLELTKHKNDYFYIRKNQVMFNIPEVAIYSIENGNKILFSPFEGAKEDQIRLYLLGTCMGILLMQRKILPLHGSAIAINGKAYAIVGDSGAGKSTLAAAFLNKGYKLISDDVIPVSFNDDNIPMVTPAYPQQKLWQQSLDNFGRDSSNLRPVVDRETKFAVPVVNQFCNEQLPLAGVFELVKTDIDSIEFRTVQNLSRLQTLFTHTYRNFLLEPLGLLDWHFQITARLASKVDVYRLERPATQFTAHELADLILSTIQKEST